MNLIELDILLNWFQAALADTEAAVVNVLSASSSLFTLILAGVFPSEPGTFFILFWTLSVDIFVKIRPHVWVFKKFDFAANLQKY